MSSAVCAYVLYRFLSSLLCDMVNIRQYDNSFCAATVWLHIFKVNAFRVFFVIFVTFFGITCVAVFVLVKHCFVVVINLLSASVKNHFH